ncbi:MAG: hypothetical protein N2C14_09970 [Planctomycetales bacterium]
MSREWATQPDWIEIPEFEVEFSGSGSSVHFASREVLGKHVLSSGVVSFTVTLSIHTNQSPIQYSFDWANYSGLRSLRDGIFELRNGTNSPVSRKSSSFSFTLSQHKFGVRQELLLEGAYSTIRGLRFSPWPIRKPIGDLVLQDYDPMACIRFAFLIPDPTYLDTPIAQINELMQFLEDEGFTP